MTSLQSDPGLTADNRAAVESGHGESGLVRKAVRRAQRGDMEALHFLYARYAPDVLCHVQDLVRSDREAEDITQNLFVGLIARMEKYEAREEPFIAWLLGVAHDAALEHAGTGQPDKVS